MNREATTMKPGTRLYATNSSCEIVVVRPPREDVEVSCGDAPMHTEAAGSSAQGDTPDGATEIGKRYTHPGSGLEVLCTKAGPGVLAVGGEPLERVEARALPSSD